MTDASLLDARFPGMPGTVHAHGFPYWKHPVLRQCFPGRRVVFFDTQRTLPQGAWLALWGMAPVPPGIGAGVTVLRVEDGFLRSAGLGADLVRPMSWAFDASGIYYDATRPSDLESMLQGGAFDERMLQRATALRERLVDSGLTKYNVGARTWQRPSSAGRVVLVPGQVESDASIRYGAPAGRTNMALLQAVRRAQPHAHIVYKPHPDVVAGLRITGEGELHAARWCDEIVTDASMGQLLQSVDEVHVLTSLAGFEAILRGKPVTCHGQPFYAGWGLTHDLVPVPRRTRRLSVSALVAAALIQYPLYMSRDGRRLLSAEQALDALLEWRRATGGREPFWRGIYRFFLRRIVGVR